jgi:hypothetical protein
VADPLCSKGLVLKKRRSKKSTFIGPLPHEKDEHGRPAVRIGTVFPNTRTIVTLPVIHLFQRMAYHRHLLERPENPLSPEEADVEKDQAVDFVSEGDVILIRPDPDNMELAFRGDEILSRAFGRKKVRFLFAENKKVRTAIKERGEYWRINPLPFSKHEMRDVIRRSKMAMSGHQIYFYSNETGTRFLTYQNFAGLANLSNEQLLAHLLEISGLADREPNRLGNPEIEFFLANQSFSTKDFAEINFAALEETELREVFVKLREKFRRAVPVEYQFDDIGAPEWRARMFAALIGRKNDNVPEEDLLGLGPEFTLQIEWLPGGRFEKGGLIPDPVTEKSGKFSGATPEEIASYEKVRAFIINFIREYGELQFVNVGRVAESLSNRDTPRLTDGRREVYVAELKTPGASKPIIRMIRMQKYGVRERLDEGKGWAQAMRESEEYSDYVLNRRLACRQLGMNLTQRLSLARITETYHPKDPHAASEIIWSPYFERDYVDGVATDKIPRSRFASPRYALAFARLLGAAAAPNMIIGRYDLDQQVVFDDGDELIVEDENGIPVDLVMSDQMGSFRDYDGDLLEVVEAYAKPVLDRLEFLPNKWAFAEAYVESFLRRFREIQNMYHERQEAFDSLFNHRRYDPHGSFAFRWAEVLKRLDNARPDELAQGIRDVLASEMDEDEPSGIESTCPSAPPSPDYS